MSNQYFVFVLYSACGPDPYQRPQQGYGYPGSSNHTPGVMGEPMMTMPAYGHPHGSGMAQNMPPNPGMMIHNGMPGGPHGMHGGPHGMPYGPHGMSGDPHGMPGGPHGMSGGPHGMPVGPHGMPGGPHGMPGGPHGMPGGPHGMPGGPHGMLGGSHDGMHRGPHGIVGGPHGTSGGMGVPSNLRREDTISVQNPFSDVPLMPQQHPMGMNYMGGDGSHAFPQYGSREPGGRVAPEHATFQAHQFNGPTGGGGGGMEYRPYQGSNKDSRMPAESSDVLPAWTNSKPSYPVDRFVTTFFSNILRNYNVEIDVLVFRYSNLYTVSFSNFN